MKRLDELGISPAPWEIGQYFRDGKRCRNVKSSHGVQDHVADVPSEADARLISAAPKLYDALFNICFGESTTVNCAKCGGNDHSGVEYCSKTCPLYNTRAALAEAAGEREVKR